MVFTRSYVHMFRRSKQNYSPFFQSKINPESEFANRFCNFCHVNLCQFSCSIFQRNNIYCNHRYVFSIYHLPIVIPFMSSINSHIRNTHFYTQCRHTYGVFQYVYTAFSKCRLYAIQMSSFLYNLFYTPSL